MTTVSLGVEEVRQIAFLARLRFSDSELLELTRQLGAIVAYVGMIEGAEGLDSPAPSGEAPLRSDGASNPSGFEVADSFLKGAPARDADLLVVPRVLE